MNRRPTWILTAAIAIVALIGLAVIWWPRASSPGSLGSEEATTAGGEEQEIVTLFFPGPDRKLVEEERKITSRLFPEDKARRIAQELIAGPRREGLYPPFPSEVEVHGTYTGRNQVLYVDLHRPESGPPPAAGSLQELLIVYSLVNSVAINVDGIDRVVLLWNGNQPASLSGHLANGRPLAANLGLVAASP